MEKDRQDIRMLSNRSIINLVQRILGLETYGDRVKFLVV
jgi:hypothetical protein